MTFQWLGVYDVIGMPFWIFRPWMILISINFHFLCIRIYESMLVQVGSFWIPFSLFKTVVSQMMWSGVEDAKNPIDALGHNFKEIFAIDEAIRAIVCLEIHNSQYRFFWWNLIQPCEYFFYCCILSHLIDLFSKNKIEERSHIAQEVVLALSKWTG